MLKLSLFYSVDRYIFDLLGKVHITFESKNEILDVLEKIIAYLNADGM